MPHKVIASQATPYQLGGSDGAGGPVGLLVFLGIRSLQGTRGAALVLRAEMILCFSAAQEGCHGKRRRGRRNIPEAADATSRQVFSSAGFSRVAPPTAGNWLFFHETFQMQLRD